MTVVDGSSLSSFNRVDAYRNARGYSVTAASMNSLSSFSRVDAYRSPYVLFRYRGEYIALDQIKLHPDPILAAQHLLMK